MHRVVRSFAVLSAATSVTAVALTGWWARGLTPVSVTVLIALTWAAAVAVVDVGTTWRRPVADAATVASGQAVTFIVRLGDERADVARASIVLAAQAGPVVVVTTRHHALLDDVDHLAGTEVRECVADTMAQAMTQALQGVTTDAVLVLSASAFPLRGPCERAAARLTTEGAGGIGWITGTAAPFNDDRYAPGHREVVAARMRIGGQRVGLITWEPDATIVRTDLLRAHPIESGRPDGRWLRDRARAGWHGATVAEPVARRAAAADAPVFWPTEVMRERGAVADLADAFASGTPRVRLVAAGALLRALFAYPVALWLAAIVLIGRSSRFPLAVSPVSFFAMCGALACTRWLASRVAYDVGLHPLDEAHEAAYDLPGSFLALAAALTRRVRPTRVHISEQPLLWLALVLTLLTTLPLLDRHSTTTSAIGVSVGLTVVALAATWVFALRAFGARAWERSTYRISVELPVTVGGSPARTIDGSPSGLAVIGAPNGFERGARVDVVVAFDDDHDDPRGPPMHARVVAVRDVGGRTVTRLALELDAHERGRWVRHLFAAAGIVDDGALRLDTTPAPMPKPTRFVLEPDRAPAAERVRTAVRVALVSAVSALVGSALLLSFLGYRPMVVRSGSMRPTLNVGDVVVARWIRADRLRPGEIVTFPADIERHQLITHRVQSATVSGDVVTVTTKGDANAEPEKWSTARGALVGDVSWSIPKIGTVIVVLGETATRWWLLAVSGAVAAMRAIGFIRRRRRRADVALATA